MSDQKPGTLAAALATVQHKLPRVTKGERADVRSEKGSYSYNYADLADVSQQIMPLLGECGLSFICRPTYNSNGRFVLAYSLLHVSGEREDGEYPLSTGGTPQQLGSAITYGRRYCLCAVTGVAPEDDDDDGAEAQTQRPQRNAQQNNQPDEDAWYTRSRQEADAMSAQTIADEAADTGITRDLLRTLWDRAKERRLLDTKAASPDTGAALKLRDYLTERAQVAADNDAGDPQQAEDEAATDEAAAEVAQ